jgi:hypothetical protein
MESQGFIVVDTGRLTDAKLAANILSQSILLPLIFLDVRLRNHKRVPFFFFKLILFFWIKYVTYC